MSAAIYDDGTYASENPAWHMEDSPWKSRRIARLIEGLSEKPLSIAEIGCGAGLILELLRHEHAIDAEMYGFDVSYDAEKIWAMRRPGVNYRRMNILDSDLTFDLLLCIDVFEHISDYMGFLTRLAQHAKTFIFHIPLELHVASILTDRHLRSRAEVGHLHYFSRATALATLKDCGYRVLGDQLSCHILDEPAVKSKRGLGAHTLAGLARRAVSAASPALAAKVLGGYSLWVVAERSGEATTS